MSLVQLSETRTIFLPLPKRMSEIEAKILSPCMIQCCGQHRCVLQYPVFIDARPAFCIAGAWQGGIAARACVSALLSWDTLSAVGTICVRIAGNLSGFPTNGARLATGAIAASITDLRVNAHLGHRREPR